MPEAENCPGVLTPVLAGRSGQKWRYEDELSADHPSPSVHAGRPTPTSNLVTLKTWRLLPIIRGNDRMRGGPAGAGSLPVGARRPGKRERPADVNSWQRTGGAATMGAISLEDTWRRFKHARDGRARDALITHYGYLVKITAGRIASGVPRCLEHDDILSAGVIGLIRAVDHFDPGRCMKFETYAIALIRGAILELMRGEDWHLVRRASGSGSSSGPMPP